MAKYKTKGNLIHDNVDYAIGSIIEMKPENAKKLLELGVIELTKEEVPPDQEEKIVDKFSAPSSVPEIEKAVASATLVPIKRGKCPKCKVEREIKNPQVSQSEKGVIHLIGECAICGTRISRMAGRVKIETEKS